MPGLDLGHLFLLAAIALLVFGPERLQEIMRTVSRTVTEFRQASQGLPAMWDNVEAREGGDEAALGTSGEPDSPADRQMTLMEHVGELRTRILRSVIPIVLAAALCFYFSDTLLRILKAPAGAAFQINAFGPMDGFVLRWKVALFGGLVLSAPFWAYELLAFLTPALTAVERRFIFPLLVGMTLLFLMGTAFGYFMLAGMVRVMIQMFGHEVNYLPNANQYISFVVFFMLACALVFELPVVLLALVRVGILKAEALRKQRRIAYFLLFVFAEIITPVADPIVAPMIVMTPLVILYEVAIFLTRFVMPKVEQGQASQAARS